MIITAWLAALCSLFPAFLVPAIASCRGSSAQQVLAGQTAGYMIAFLLAAASFVFDRGVFLDLALALAVVNLTMALMLEHWL
jgi:biotin transporter BioY